MMGLFFREKTPDPEFLAQAGYALVNEVYETPKEIEGIITKMHLEKGVVTIMPETLATKLGVKQSNCIILRNGTKETSARVAIIQKEIIGNSIKSDCFILIGNKLIQKLNLKKNSTNNNKIVKYLPVYLRRK